MLFVAVSGTSMLLLVEAFDVGLTAQRGCCCCVAVGPWGLLVKRRVHAPIKLRLVVSKAFGGPPGSTVHIGIVGP